MEYTIKELLNDFKTGLLNPECFQVVLDNDHTGFYISGEKIIIKGLGNGESDVLELYEFIFPNSAVEKC